MKENPNKKNDLINDFIINEYNDLSNDIELYVSEVDFLNMGNGNYTKDLSKREKNMIKRFYNLTEKHLKISNENFENSVFYFYGISILLLCMLTGGIIGIIIMIYMSFKSQDLDAYNSKLIYINNN